MIDKIVLIFFLILVYEILFFFKILNRITKNLNTLYKIIKLFSLEQMSDLSKEKLLFKYSKILIKESLFIIFILLLISLLIFILYYFFNTSFYFLLSLNGTLIILVLCIGYHYLRRWINAKL